jgi:hypothetical protein
MVPLPGAPGRGEKKGGRKRRRDVNGENQSAGRSHFWERAAEGVWIVYRLGRFLQLLGLLIAPVGMAGNLADKERVGEGKMLAILAAGIIVFAIGWLIQRGAKPQ